MNFLFALMSQFLFFSTPALAWNWVGHELVAQIAYDQLTLKEKTYWERRVAGLHPVYPHENFIWVSVFPDNLRKRGITAFNSWHFIDLPVFLGKIPLEKISLNSPFSKGKKADNGMDPHNIVWAIEESLKVEKDRKATDFELGFFAAFLIHLVADAHQPLHCADLYSKHFPEGDRGGNLFRLKDKEFPNLHRYWDQGGGFLSWKIADNLTLLGKSARALEEKYPKSWFGKRVYDLNPQTWVNESHRIAVRDAYTIQENTTPSARYQKSTQQLTQEQIVLAGYRLAALLKQIENTATS